MRMDYLIDNYYEGNKPIQMGPTTELPTSLSLFYISDMYYDGVVGGALNISFGIYAELPSIINFDSNIEETVFLEKDLTQYKRDGQKLDNPVMINQPIDYVFEGWYTTESFEEGTKWDFEKNKVATNAYVFEDPFARSGIVQTPENFYAKWTPRSEYVTVDFVTNNDQTIEDQFIKKVL